MLCEVTSPSAYFSHLAIGWLKQSLLALRGIIFRQDPGIEESIADTMLCYPLNGSVLFHLNAQKANVILYCGNTKKIDPERILLTGLNIVKGCIRFSQTKFFLKLLSSSL